MVFTKSMFKGCQYGLFCFDRLGIKWLLLILSFIPPLCHVIVVAPIKLRIEIYQWTVHFHPETWISYLCAVFFLILYFFACLSFKKDSKALIDTFVFALAFVLPSGMGSGVLLPVRWSLHAYVCVCAARLTLLALLAASSMLLAGGLLQGSALDKNSPKNQDLENGPCAQTSSVGSSTLKCLETICFLLSLMMNFCRVPLLVLSKYLELGKLRQLGA